MCTTCEGHLTLDFHDNRTNPNHLLQVKTKSWFGAVEAMDYLCDNWTLLGTVLDHALKQRGAAARPAQV